MGARRSGDLAPVNKDQLNAILVGAAAFLTVVCLLWFWSIANWISIWPLVAGALAVVAAIVVLVWLVPGRWQSLAWGVGAGLLLVVETLWRAYDLPEAGRVYQAVAWGVSIAVTGISGYFSAAGWQAGLRTGLAAQLTATVGWALVLGIGFGQPVMAAALDIGGSLDQFAHAPALVFWTWVAEDFFGSTALRLALACGWGAGLGWCGGWISERWKARGKVKRP